MDKPQGEDGKQTVDLGEDGGAMGRIRSTCCWGGGSEAVPESSTSNNGSSNNGVTINGNVNAGGKERVTPSPQPSRSSVNSSVKSAW